jgi:hypothetical protein
MTMTIPRRTVKPDVAVYVLDFVSSGDLTMEAAMRLVFPEEADIRYNAARWPWGPPEEEMRRQ